MIFWVLAAALTPCLVGPAEPAAAFAPSCQNAGSPAQGAPAPAGVPWAQQRLGADDLATLATGAGVRVAVIDSGVQKRAGVVGGGDLIDTQGDGTLDCIGHGTGVAGIINGAAAQQFHGLAPRATVVSLRVTEREETDGQTVGRTAGATGLAAAIRRAVQLKVQVINLSLVAYGDSTDVHAAVDSAIGHNIVVVAAAGNRHGTGGAADPTPYPAAYDGVVGVGALGVDGSRLPSSQTGPYVDLVAPGGQIVTTAIPDGLTVQEGTSFATPFVAASAALVIERDRRLHGSYRATDVVRRLLATADPAPGGPASQEYGAGVVDPFRALTDEVAGPAAVAGGPAGTPRGAPAPGGPAGAAPPTARPSAVAVAAGAAMLAVLALIAAVVWPRGRRRRWRPGVTHVPSAADLPTVDPMAPAFGEPTVGAARPR
jgi:type VII secretion-associated serine protease mycosin